MSRKKSFYDFDTESLTPVNVASFKNLTRSLYSIIDTCMSGQLLCNSVVGKGW